MEKHSQPINQLSIVDLTALRLREEQGESIDVMQEFVQVAESPSIAALQFVETFTQEVGQSTDIKTFQWRIATATKPEYFKRACNRIDIDSKTKSWIPRYGSRLAEQLGEFVLRKPDEVANAGVAWCESVSVLLQDSRINSKVRNTIERTSRSELVQAMYNPGSIKSVASFIALKAFEPQ